MLENCRREPEEESAHQAHEGAHQNTLVDFHVLEPGEAAPSPRNASIPRALGHSDQAPGQTQHQVSVRSCSAMRRRLASMATRVETSPSCRWLLPTAG